MRVKVLNNIFEITNKKTDIDEIFIKIDRVIANSNLRLKDIKVNGLTIYEEYYNYVINNLNNIDIIEINTESQKEFMFNLFKSTESYLENVIPELELLIENMYKSFNKEMWNKFIELFDGLDSIVNVVDILSDDKQYNNSKRYNLIKEKLSVGIKNLSKAMEVDDRVWISDVIIYEIKVLFQELYIEIKRDMENTNISVIE